jgi:hypothetical protein
MSEQPLYTSITLNLEHVDPRLSAAHRELYPERIAEEIPSSLTLLHLASGARGDGRRPRRSASALRRAAGLEFDQTRFRLVLRDRGRNRRSQNAGLSLMELAGLEPATSWVRSRRSVGRNSA